MLRDLSLRTAHCPQWAWFRRLPPLCISFGCWQSAWCSFVRFPTQGEDPDRPVRNRKPQDEKIKNQDTFGRRIFKAYRQCRQLTERLCAVTMPALLPDDVRAVSEADRAREFRLTRSSLSIQPFGGSRFVRGGRYGISIDFGLEVVEKQSVCGTMFKSEFIALTKKLKLTIASS